MVEKIFGGAGNEVSGAFSFLFGPLVQIYLSK